MARGHYTTKQQQLILNRLQQFDDFITVDALYEALLQDGVKVGRATVYRFLERLEQERVVVTCKASDSTRTEYRYLPKTAHKSHPPQDSAGKLCCTVCGRTFPLHCMQLKGFARHIFNEHGFILETGKTILYGQCAECAKIQQEDFHHEK